MDNQSKKIMQLVYEGKISASDGYALYSALAESGASCSAGGDIAVTGMSGVFPGAKNTDEFWKNLVSGTDSIQDIGQRWDIGGIYDPDRSVKHRSYCRRGGLVDGVDRFDPLFFELSPKQAEKMEPRQRLFLMESYRALEDAGCSPESLRGNKCGVFAGCEGSSDYFKDVKAESLDAHTFLGHSNSVLAARISYLLDLKGPSVTVDTACSSSLVALHLACNAIRNGDCEMAVAGGVQVFTNPGFYILLCSMGMLSPEGRCQTFDQSADGFVPGEGACAVVLKPLARAVQNHDVIYGVIKGSAVNQDGRSNGITSPSAVSQATLESEVYEKCGINPETIGYIEAHGTGTKLGDPIEVNALTQAFRKHTDKKQFCAIGSVKTNIGHTGAASGIASLIKVLLSFRHGKIPPSLHFSTPNPAIDFENSPFYVPTSTQDFKKSEGVPRRAAVSAFGHSGTNCHVLVEEYNQAENAETANARPIYPILLSAKTESALKSKIHDLHNWAAAGGKGSRLSDIAYTLACGRGHFRCRCYFTAVDFEDFEGKLRMLDSGADPIGCRFGTAGTNVAKKPDDSGIEKMLASIPPQGADDRSIRELFEKAGEVYTNGGDFSWESFFYGCRKIPLPAYPFELKEYWLPAEDTVSARVSRTTLSELVDTNDSTLTSVCFSKHFDGREFFIKDHMGMLPAVVYAEMIRSAGEFAAGDRKITEIRNITLLKPITIEENTGKTVHMLFTPKKDSLAGFEIYTVDDGRKNVHCQGETVYGTASEYGPIGITDVKKRCGGTDAAPEFYKRIGSRGVVLGPRFRGMTRLLYNASEAISDLKIPAELEAKLCDYTMFPTLMDGGLQSAIAWAYGTSPDPAVYLPFVIKKLEIVNPELRSCHAYVKRTGEEGGGIEKSLYNIDYLSGDGTIAFKITGFSLREFRPELVVERGAEDAGSLLYFTDEFKEEPVTAPNGGKQPLTVVFERGLAVSQELAGFGRVVTVAPGKHFEKTGANCYSINAADAADYARLTEELDLGGEVTRIVHCWCMDQTENTARKLEFGVYSLLHLTKAVLAGNRNARLRLLFLHNGDALYRAASGFVKSLRAEREKLSYKVIQIESKNGRALPPDAGWIEREFDTPYVPGEIRYADGKRYREQLKEIGTTVKDRAPVLRNGGVYLLTGGAGGLGLMFAKQLSDRYNAKAVLVGRSELGREKRIAVEQLGALYVRADITKPEDAALAAETAARTFGTVNGVIHMAGVIKDSRIENKSAGEMTDVLQPKISGLLNLERAFSGKGLDFMALFSSTTAVFGNPGQTDYAFANAFLDTCAGELNSRGTPGRVVAINWPVWNGGGMKIDDSVQQFLKDSFGMEKMPDAAGFKAFETCLAEKAGRITVLYGDAVKIRGKIKHFSVSKDESPVKPVSDEATTRLQRLFQSDMLDLICGVLKLDGSCMDIHSDMDTFGFDSITFTELSNEINSKYDMGITPALFYGDSSPADIIEKLFSEHCSEISEYYRNDMVESGEKGDPWTSPTEKTGQSMVVPLPSTGTSSAASGTEYEPVAIVGMAGVMPQSGSLEEFWKGIADGKDFMTVIPKDRWNYEEYYGDPEKEEGKTRVKWGAFMNEIDKFDPLFFNISGSDAEKMDPQERLILESAWSAIEDAGYRPSYFSGSDTGVFVGVSSADYKELLLKNGYPAMLSQTFLANRVSYVLNLHGPSVPVDTACSSSLVALHDAVEAIQRGECSAALAGGVNVIASPNLYITESKANVLSEDGCCKTFDASADGYARGEGVGMLLLKPLRNAKADGDHIYGVIIGSAVNHGGHGSSLMAPNAKLQAEVIVAANRKAGIDPSTIGYIETHGTGTKLGDPVEINGLKTAFGILYKDWGLKPDSGRTLLGALKTNIGHLEAASGIAGMLKVLLALKHGVLPGLVHFKELNPYIDLKGSPFEILKDGTEWQRRKDPEGKDIPRRAGISSFGIGGVNAHVIIEEYLGAPRGSAVKGPFLFAVSAKTKESLRDNCEALIEYMENAGSSAVSSIGENSAVSDMTDEIIQIISEILKIEPGNIPAETGLAELGFDPVTVAKLTETVNKKYKAGLSVGRLLQCGTAGQIAAFIRRQRSTQPSSGNAPEHQKGVNAGGLPPAECIAYTLQTGREEFQYRLAVVADGSEEFSAKLQAYCKTGSEVNGLYTGDSRQGGVYRELLTGKAGAKFIENMISENDIGKLAALWVNGVNVDWNRLYDGGPVARISLPGYRFARERYWIPQEPGPMLQPVAQSLENTAAGVRVDDDDELMRKLLSLKNGSITVEDMDC